jgi:hypothetical protein
MKLSTRAEPLGLTVKDTITGFTGVVSGYVRYLSGCNQALVVPRVGKDNKPVDPMWLDEQRLEVNPKVKPIVLDNGDHPGADVSPPVR